MLIGTAQVDITPQPGIDLVGFAVRSQPSTGVLDPLAVRALYLEDKSERLLWLHADLLALEEPFVVELRDHIQRELNIPEKRVLISTTHTHSGPPTVHLTGCGEYNPAYVNWVKEQFFQAAKSALAVPEPCNLVVVQGTCNLGIDRRGFSSAHTDTSVLAAGWRRSDGTFKAILVNYGMHAVCLCGTEISADWPGETARVLSQSLPGNPITLVCSGACGNVDPPSVGVSPEQMRQWGGNVAHSILAELLSASPSFQPPEKHLLSVATMIVPLPLEPSTVKEINQYADHALANPLGQQEFGQKYILAVETWRRSMTQQVVAGKTPNANVELFAVRLGPVILLAINAEIFSKFGEFVGKGYKYPLHVIGCANGMIGYVATAQAYQEGAYEVLWSMFFYNKLRPKCGGFELLAEQARRLVSQLS